jgi:hypothetical protein
MSGIEAEEAKKRTDSRQDRIKRRQIHKEDITYRFPDYNGSLGIKRDCRLGEVMMEAHREKRENREKGRQAWPEKQGEYQAKPGMEDEAVLARKNKIWDDFVRQVGRDCAEQRHGSQFPDHDTEQHHSQQSNQEHPVVAYARAMAEIDYRRRKDQEPNLVDPSKEPVRTTWTESIYMASLIAPEFVKLSRDICSQPGDGSSTSELQHPFWPPLVPDVVTSAVPAPLRRHAPPWSETTHLPVGQSSSASDGDTADESVRNQVGVACYVGGPPAPRQSQFEEYLEDDEDILPPRADFIEDKGKTCASSRSYILKSRSDRHNFSSRAPTEPYREIPAGYVVFGGTEMTKKVGKKLAKRRPNTLILRKAKCHGQDNGPESAASWETVSSLSSAKSWVKSKFGHETETDTASFKCKEAARIERAS